MNILASIVATCACGSISFRSSQPPVMQFICHCSDCRAATNAPYTNTAIFARRSCQIGGAVERREFAAASGANTTRDYCPKCGDVLLDYSDGFPDLVGVLAERIQKPFEFRPSHHIWTRSKTSDPLGWDHLPKLVKGFETP